MSNTIILLDADGLEIPVTVMRKRVKNLNLRVRSDGSVALSIPQHLPLLRAREFLERKSGWIAERIRRGAERDARQLRDGEPPEGIPLWGELIPLGSVKAGADPATHNQTTPGQVAPVQAGVDQGAIDDFYRTELIRRLPGVVARVERRIGVHAARWSVRVMKTRWGSCTPKTGAIRINARLAAYPPECLEFVVAHELVHLLEPSHNTRFHALLDEFCPENRSLSRRLRQPPFAET